jgi:RNA polymerase sigma-70 factor (ECF subfamily)
MPGVQDARVSERSGAEFERLYRAEGERLWRALLGYSGDRDVASDAVAEAFAQALRRGEALRDPRRWIWRAAFRIAAGELKRRRQGATMIETASSSESPIPMLDVVMALKQLSANQRAAVVLHHYADYPVREVASILGSTSAAVRVHLMRGRKRLRQLLEDDDG